MLIKDRYSVSKYIEIYRKNTTIVLTNISIKIDVDLKPHQKFLETIKKLVIIIYSSIAKVVIAIRKILIVNYIIIIQGIWIIVLL